MCMEGPQYWQRPSTEPLGIGAVLITLHFPCSDFFWVTDYLSSISNDSWGHWSFHILVSTPFRGSFTPLLPRYGTPHFLLWCTVPLSQSTSHCCFLPDPSEAVGRTFSPPPATGHEDGKVAGDWHLCISVGKFFLVSCRGKEWME